MVKHPLSHIKNKKVAQSREEGGFALRVFHRKSQKKKMPRYLIKCGCCKESVEIYYDKTSLEINGVMGSIENWKEIFEPLLNYKKKKKTNKKYELKKST